MQQEYIHRLTAETIDKYANNAVAQVIFSINQRVLSLPHTATLVAFV